MNGTSPVLVERAPTGVATLTLNRPERLNAISVELAEKLGAALVELDRDERVACVVLTGAGRGFCAGGDMDL